MGFIVGLFDKFRVRLSCVAGVLGGGLFRVLFYRFVR